MLTLTISDNTSLEGISLKGIDLLKVLAADAKATIESPVTENQIFAEKALSYFLYLDLHYNPQDTHKKIVQEG